VGTEINVQLGTYTIKGNQTEMLDHSIAEQPDFVDVFGPPRWGAGYLTSTALEYWSSIHSSVIKYWSSIDTAVLN
jgi:hypothetical protein